MTIRAALPRVLATACLLLTLTLGLAHAQRPEADAPITRAVPDSEATKVFVLGTPHLSAFSDRFEPSMVDSLITLLDRFEPDAIGVENISGCQAAAMERWGGRFDEVAERFAGAFLYHGHRVQEQTGRSWSEANRRADSLLAVARSDSIELDAESRLALIRSLTAAYRLPTASLHWKYLSPEARSLQSAVPDTTAEDLNKRLGAADETYSIGMRLAHKRDLQRLYPIDDQTEKDRVAEIFPTLSKAFGDSMRKAFDTHPVVQRADSLEQAGLKEGNLLPMYRYRNQEMVGRTNVELQSGTLLDADLPDAVGDQWVALWQTRNLYSVGHIQRMVSQHPGGKVLVIVGASHKPLFDAYLRQMMGVQVVDAETVLSEL
jgi:hypothetical protein